jgi:hypothetical protein
MVFGSRRLNSQYTLTLTALGKKVSPDAVLEALEAAEPNGWIGKMLADRKESGQKT